MTFCEALFIATDPVKTQVEKAGYQFYSAGRKNFPLWQHYGSVFLDRYNHVKIMRKMPRDPSVLGSFDVIFNKEMYEEMFRLALGHFQELKPTLCIVDFLPLAMIDAISSYGCPFIVNYPRAGSAGFPGGLTDILRYPQPGSGLQNTLT